MEAKAIPVTCDCDFEQAFHRFVNGAAAETLQAEVSAPLTAPLVQGSVQGLFPLNDSVIILAGLWRGRVGTVTALLGATPRCS